MATTSCNLNHISRLITASMLRSSFALERMSTSPFLPGPIDTELIMMLSGDGISKYDARKWPILPFDVSRDFIISKEILV
jgi:hypothetical protein